MEGAAADHGGARRATEFFALKTAARRRRRRGTEDEGTCTLRVRARADTHAREGIEEQALGIPNVEEDITRRDNISW